MLRSCPNALQVVLDQPPSALPVQGIHAPGASGAVCHICWAPLTPVSHKTSSFQLAASAPCLQVILDQPPSAPLVEGSHAPGARVLVSFLGGIDLCNGRYDDGTHSLFRTLGMTHSDDMHQPCIPGAEIKFGGVCFFVSFQPLYRPLKHLIELACSASLRAVQLAHEILCQH